MCGHPANSTEKMTRKTNNGKLTTAKLPPPEIPDCGIADCVDVGIPGPVAVVTDVMVVVVVVVAFETAGTALEMTVIV